MVLNEIQRGIELLDNNRDHGWPCEIDLDELDLSSPYHCVLGQLYADEPADDGTGYSRGVEALGLEDFEGDFHFEGDFPAAVHGFELYWPRTYTWADLTLGWKEALERLQAQRCGEA